MLFYFHGYEMGLKMPTSQSTYFLLLMEPKHWTQYFLSEINNYNIIKIQ